MGMADSVPGVSGGTIALITGIYEELINSIKSVNLKALTVLWQQGPAAAWKHINGNFLLTLFLGIFSALLLMANTVGHLFEFYPQYVLSFFIGLIIASCLYVGAQIKGWDMPMIVLLLLGSSLSIGLAFMPHTEAQLSLMTIFFSGAFAICAMILPGISGAFILLLLGVYEPILAALKNFDLVTIIVFMAGCATGLLAFSNLLAYLFKHYYRQTLAFLLGILIGSLYSLWPWQLESVIPTEGSQHYLPADYSVVSGVDVHIFICIGLGLVGFLLVYGLEKFAGGDERVSS